MNIPTIAIIAVLAFSVFKPINWLTYLIFILPVFGSLSLIPSGGGVNVTPVAAAVLLFIIKALCQRSVQASVKNAILDFRQLGLLFFFLIVALLGAVLLPRIFSGAIRIYPMHSINMEAVNPSTANISQSAYLVLSTFTAFIVFALAKDKAFLEKMLKAILVGAYAVIITGLMDFMASHIGMSQALEIFRTANYSMLLEGTIMGARRVIGLMPEASSYGGMAAGYCAFLLFLRPVYPKELWRRKVPFTAIACGVMALLSASSTAYVMVGIILFVYAFYGVHFVQDDGKIVRNTIIRKLGILFFVGILCLGLLVINSESLSYATGFVDTLIFKKQQTSSYMERSRWTAAALDALYNSYGLGVGVGTVRTSNFFVNVFASTGILGGTLFMSFLVVMYMRRVSAAKPHAQIMLLGAKLALLPTFVGMALAGTVPDFGVITGFLFGLIMGLGRDKKAQWVSPLTRHLSGKKAGVRSIASGANSSL